MLKFQSLKHDIRNFKKPIRKFCGDCHKEYLQKRFVEKESNALGGSVLEYSAPWGPELRQMQIYSLNFKKVVWSNVNSN